MVKIRRVWNAILGGKGSIWDTLDSRLYASDFTLYTSNLTLYTSHFTLDTPHSTLAEKLGRVEKDFDEMRRVKQGSDEMNKLRRTYMTFHKR